METFGLHFTHAAIGAFLLLTEELLGRKIALTRDWLAPKILA
jgi:hypothetical protein